MEIGNRCCEDEEPSARRNAAQTQAERNQVLERFVRGSTAIGTRGSGIGLATVVLLIQAMQGELVIGDAPGGGADMQLRFRIFDRPPAP